MIMEDRKRASTRKIGRTIDRSRVSDPAETESRDFPAEPLIPAIGGGKLIDRANYEVASWKKFLGKFSTDRASSKRKERERENIYIASDEQRNASSLLYTMMRVKLERWDHAEWTLSNEINRRGR